MALHLNFEAMKLCMQRLVCSVCASTMRYLLLIIFKVLQSDMFHIVSATHAERVASELEAEYFEVSAKFGKLASHGTKNLSNLVSPKYS